MTAKYRTTPDINKIKVAILSQPVSGLYKRKVLLTMPFELMGRESGWWPGLFISINYGVFDLLTDK